MHDRHGNRTCCHAQNTQFCLRRKDLPPSLRGVALGRARPIVSLVIATAGVIAVESLIERQKIRGPRSDDALANAIKRGLLGACSLRERTSPRPPPHRNVYETSPASLLGCADHLQPHHQFHN